MSKQTAAKWLYVKMFEKEGRITKEEYEQALQMEKEQIMQSYSDGLGNGIAVGQEECSFESVADEVKYYEQTYGGNK
jgi:hypothetical protein